MTTLPSFVQLMASLGLDNERQPLEGPGVSPRGSPHSRASSVASVSGRSSPLAQPSRGANVRRLQSSPSIVVTSDASRSPSSDSRRRVSPAPRARFSPYTAPVDVRRGSLPSLYPEDSRCDVAGHRRVRSNVSDVSSHAPTRSKSDSSSSQSHRPAALRISGPHRRRGRLSAENDLGLATPISALARRKSPQASPTSAHFPSRVQDSPPFPLTPVSVPTLPPAVFGQLQSFTFPSSEDDKLYAHAATSKERSARTGIRLSNRLGGDSDDERSLRH